MNFKGMVLSLVLSAFAACALAQQGVQQLADSVVKYQTKSGGWAKNQDWMKGVNPAEAKVWWKTGVGATIDNGATTKELDLLAQALDKEAEVAQLRLEWLDKGVQGEKTERYRQAFRRGVAYLLGMQYGGGGFPQYYPPKAKGDYSAHITFNDNAMVNALKVLRDVANDAERFKNVGIDKNMKKKCREAYERGIRCILLCQIRVDEKGRVLEFDTQDWKMGRPTVWCQQHDERTFAPVGARAYELPSYSGCGETCAILNLLMDEEHPTAEVREAVARGVEWLEEHAIRDSVLERFVDESGRDDVRLVAKEGAPLLWARFYDLERAEPMFCDRDGVPHKSLSDIGYERRNGYAWVRDEPQKVIARYKEWSQK